MTVSDEEAVRRGERLLSSALVDLADRDGETLARFYDLTAPHLVGLVLEVDQGETSADLLRRIYVELWYRATGYRADEDAVAWILGVAVEVLSAAAPDTDAVR